MARFLLFLPFFLVAVPVFVPGAAACSLVGYEPFSRNQWIDDRHVLTPYYGGVGVFDTVTHDFILGFHALHITDAVVSPDGNWLVVSYWNGGLDADCSHDVEAVDAFDMQTHERHPLFDGAASAFAATREGLGVFGPHSDRIVFYEWGEWETPTRIPFKIESRPDLTTDQVTFAALTSARDWVAVFSDKHVFVIDLTESKLIMYDPIQFFPGVNPFAFSPDAKGLAWVGTHDESILRVLSLDRTGTGQVASRSEPPSANGLNITGSPVWNAKGILVPMSDRLRVYSDPTRLDQFNDTVLQGRPHGESDWSPDATKLFVGGRSSSDPEHWMPTYWILDENLDVLANYTLETMFVQAPATRWEDVPQGNQDPRDDRYHNMVPQRQPEFFAPGAGFLTVLLLVTMALFTTRTRFAKKP